MFITQSICAELAIYRVDVVPSHAHMTVDQVSWNDNLICLFLTSYISVLGLPFLVPNYSVEPPNVDTFGT